MTGCDDSILEFLQNDPGRPIRASPSVIDANINYAKSTINDRVKKLRDNGLIAYYDKDAGIYEITQLGLDYLAGRVEASELED